MSICLQNFEHTLTQKHSHHYDESERSPYHPERFTRPDDLLREYENANAQNSPRAPLLQPTRYQHKPKGLSQSVSENNITFRRNDDPRQLPHKPSQYFQYYDAVNTTANQDSLPSQSARARGRLPARNLSPSKGLEDIEEDQSPKPVQDGRSLEEKPILLPTSPTKRSRSPMKQLFGENGFLGRSTSMKELQSEDYRKKGVKHLGEKFKHCVGGMVSHANHSK